MPRARPDPRLLVLPALLAVATLAGCHVTREYRTEPLDVIQSHTFYHENYVEKRLVLKPQVETVTVIHPVSFDDGQDRLDPKAVARLNRFLRDSSAGEGARIEIDGPRLHGAAHDTLTAARLSSLRMELARLGLRSEISAHPVEMLAKPQDAVVVLVTRAMVIAPDCNGGTRPRALRTDYIWTCADAAALGMMVADPLDLERGRGLDPADGEASVRSIQRYRKDEIKPLNTEQTSN